MEKMKTDVAVVAAGPAGLAAAAAALEGGAMPGARCAGPMERLQGFMQKQQKERRNHGPERTA